ncbi:acyl-CoA thioesterase II [Apiospora hydei]|uniref:Acyl-CoA thioesterase II n=1 Tax=Apiospora hydei TaxID=1337664 RepID=A0ABR1W0F4_9PEZI
MTSRAPIESYVAVVPAPTLGPDTYVNERPLAEQDGRGSVFGGLLLAQAISAASSTVPDPDFYAYTSSSSFIRPVAQTKKIRYRVERVSDGRNFATRIVRASVDDSNGNAVTVYVATISFQKRQDATASRAQAYAEAPPDLGGARLEDIAKGSGRQQVESNRTGLLQPFTPEDEPFDWRPAAMELGDLPPESRLAGFSCSVAPLSTGCTTATNLAALAYMSDEMLIAVAIFANPDAVGPRSLNVAMAVTLNHHLWFHDPGVRVDRWMVGERRTSCGADGRVLIHQKVWDHETGRLVMTCAQEALIRLKGPSL